MMKQFLALTLCLAIAIGWVAASEDEAATAAAASEAAWEQTVVLIQKEVAFGQFVFLRGGIGADQREGCGGDADEDPCAIPIRHNQITDTNNTEYNDWAAGDDFLDWHGTESDQGAGAQGTPLVWTTNDTSHPASVAEDGYGYSPYNSFGDHFWMMDVEMDCSETEEGWFELKGFGPNWSGEYEWEAGIDQVSLCAGSANATKPYSSQNHFAKCGHINVFVFNWDGCRID